MRSGIEKGWPGWYVPSLIVPLLWTGIRHHPPGRTNKIFCRCFGAQACRGFPDHLIIFLGSS